MQRCRRRAVDRDHPAFDGLSSLRHSAGGLATLAAAAARRLASVYAGDLAGGTRRLADFVTAYGQLAQRRRRGDVGVDEFGFDSEWTDALLPITAWVYRNWWRVQAIGVENVPADGRALLVANHAGVIPYDGAMVRTAVLLEHPQPRHTRALVLDGLSPCLSRLG